MPINLDEAIGAELAPVEFSWTSSDVQLYHLGLGAGHDPMDPRELRYLTDNTPQVLPTFGNVAQSFHMTEPPTVKFPGIDIELSRVLHASEAISAPGPIPAEGTGTAVTRFTEIWDKGKAAVIWSETSVTDPAGKLLWTQKRSIFARGEGGFGGDRGPSVGVVIPDRSPDLEIDVPTLPQQALLYRLCGDRNPLHSDPEFASAAGFPRPILHGLANFEGMRGQIYNVGLTEANVSKRELCQHIQKQLPDFVFLDAPVGKDPDQRNYVVSNAKLERTGFKTAVTLDAGITELIKGFTMVKNTVHGNV